MCWAGRLRHRPCATTEPGRRDLTDRPLCLNPAVHHDAARQLSRLSGAPSSTLGLPTTPPEHGLQRFTLQ
jgi:hypothetical protein